MKSKLLPLFLLVAAALGGWKLYDTQTKSNGTVTYHGNVDTRTLTLGFQTMGKLERITKDEGERVKAGEELVFMEHKKLIAALEELDARIEAQKSYVSKLTNGFRDEEIAQAEASWQEAAAQAAKAEDEYRRQRALYQTDATSEQRFTNAKLELQRAKALKAKAQALYRLQKKGYRTEDIRMEKANLAALQAQRKQLLQDIEDRVLTSPVAGVILSRYKEPGSVANPGESVLEIAKEDEFWIRAYVDERDLGSIKPGMEMLIHTDGRQAPYHGTVGFISPVAEFTPKNIETRQLRTDLVFRFRLLVRDPDEHLRQGMPVTVTPKSP